jgi:ornithine carbamoyltransferase
MHKCNSRACARSRSTTTRVHALLHSEKSRTTTYSGKGVTAPAQGKHFLHLDDFAKDELLDMLDRGKFAKAKFYARDESFKPFKGMSMAMIFTKPSARTRVSFETVRPGCVAFEAHWHMLDPSSSQECPSSAAARSRLRKLL